MKNDRNILLIVLAIIAVFIMSVMITYDVNAQSRLKWYRNYQKSVEFEGWKDKQPKFRIEQVKYAVQVSKENSKESKENKRLNDKIERIRRKIK